MIATNGKSGDLSLLPWHLMFGIEVLWLCEGDEVFVMSLTPMASDIVLSIQATAQC